MAKLPPSVAQAMLVPSLSDYLISRGKVRDTYRHPNDPGKLVVVATNRISIFDFVLSALVPRKGEVLTALTHFWLTYVLDDIPNHLARNAGSTDTPAAILKSQYPDIPLERTLVVRKLNILPYELIFRAHLGGSVWKQYQGTGKVAGVALPSGLTKWQQLDEPLFTPTIKAETGHDDDVTQAEYFERTGDVGRKAEAMTRSVYEQGYRYAKELGIIILDTKFEVGINELGDLVLADEVLTPDSSRFTTTADLVDALAKKREPVFHDKQPVREWGRTVVTPFKNSQGEPIVGLQKRDNPADCLDPANEEHVAFVHGLQVPEQVIQQCTQRYLGIFQRLARTDLDTYQR